MKSKHNILNFVGSRLKDARAVRNLTGEQLATYLGVTRQAISSYECGDKTPRGDTISRMSEFLRLPPDYFYLPDGMADSFGKSTVFYRSLSSATKNARHSAEVKRKWFHLIVEYLSHFIELPHANIPDFDMPSNPEKITFDDIELTALKTRQFWGLQYGPISNIVWLLENNGITVGRFSLNADELDAFSEWVSSKPFIFLNSDKNSSVRSRFDGVHELGHLILHSNVPKNLYSMSGHFKLMEQQAHRFASAFLFPKKSFFDQVFLPDLDYFLSIKQRWGVSIGAMIMRSVDLEMVNDIEAQSLWRKYSRLGYKKKEPLDEKIPVEKPRIIAGSIKLILEKKLQTFEDILNYVKLFHNEIEELASLPHNFLSNQKTIIELPVKSYVQPQGIFDSAKPSTDSLKVIRLFGD